MTDDKAVSVVETPGKQGPVERLVGLIERRPWWILLCAAVLAGTSVWLATQLRVNQNLSALLPPDAESLTRLEALQSRMGTLNDLIVEIKSPSREANIRFGDAMAERLRARDDIRYALFFQDRSFFEDRALLYMEVPDLLELRQKVIDRIKKEVARDLQVDFGDPEPAGADKDKVEDDFDFSAESLRAQYGVDDKLPEYFEADEGRLMVVKARPTRNTTDVSFTKALLKGAEADIAALAPASYHAEMTVTLEGSYASRGKDVRTIAGDAARGGAVAVVLLLLLLWFYFRRFRAVPVVMIPLLMSVVMALGYAQLRFGFLNIVSAFIFAVLLGIGIDFGIHVLGRYESERHRRHDRGAALRIALKTTGMSTLAGAFSTIGVYAALMVADFQGFAQFGEIAAVGILTAAISVFTVVPALIVVMERRFPWKPTKRGLKVHAEASQAALDGGLMAPANRATPSMLRWAAIVLVLGGAWGVYSAVRAPDVEFEYNFKKLGPIPEKSVDAGPKVPTVSFKDAVGRASTLGPVVALTASLEETAWVDGLLSDAMALTPHQIANLDAVKAGTYVPPKEAAAEPDGKPAEPESEPDPLDAFDDDEEDPFDGPDPEDAAIDAIAARAKGVGQLSELARTRLAGFSNARIAVMNRTLVQVFSIGSFLPEGQPDKLTIVGDIRRRIDAKEGALSADTRKKLEDTRRYLAVDAPVSVGDLPNWVKVQFVDDTGELGRFVVFRNSGSKSDYLVSKELHETFFTIEGPDGPIPTAGNLYVMPEMLDTVASDGPVVVALALLVVLLTAFALFRNFLGVASVAITVVLAVLWLVGVMYVLEWKANFFNLIAIPLLLGMGQDYALHLYHRYQHDGIGKMRRILRETGGAVLMTTVTTIIGFSGMLFANHLGILSLAWTSVVGLAFCFAAAVFILPAVLVMVSRFSQRRQPVANGDAE